MAKASPITIQYDAEMLSGLEQAVLNALRQHAVEQRELTGNYDVETVINVVMEGDQIGVSGVTGVPAMQSTDGGAEQSWLGAQGSTDPRDWEKEPVRFPARNDDHGDLEFQTIPEYIRMIVTQAVGAGSVCWEHMEGTGVFDDQHAQKVAAAAYERIMGQVHPGEAKVDTSALDAALGTTLNVLVSQSGINSRDHGFHDDIPKRDEYVDGEKGDAAFKRDSTNFLIAKLDLIHEEVSESLGELRSGRGPLEVYYVDKATKQEYSEQAFDDDGNALYKPEGFGIELADAVIRIADLLFITGDDLQKLVDIKHRYNATRPYKHGRVL